MAEEFQAGICGDNWWNISSLNIFGGGSGGTPCSRAVLDMMGGYGWPAADVMDLKSRSTCGIETISVSDSSMIFQDAQKLQHQTDFIHSTLHVMDFGLSSSSASDWNQSVLCSNGSLLQEDMTSKFTEIDSPEIQKDLSDGTENSTIKPLIEPISTDDFPVSSSSSFPVVSSSPSYEHQPTMLNNLLSPETRQSDYNNEFMTANYEMNSNGFSPSWMKTSLPKLQPSNIHYNNASLCNAPKTVANNLQANLVPSPQTNILGSSFEEQNKIISEHFRDVKYIETEPNPPLKRSRIETPSSLPTFKVRKEKLGDRITALQQLVSPFGKTDTASVLQEAIEYIKFLHDQVNTLSTPYLKNGAANTRPQQACEQINGTEEPELDLRSRGLCLVPLSSTFPVANETVADFWTPTFGGPYM